MSLLVSGPISRDHNNFDNIRFGLALIVFFSHALGLPDSNILNSYQVFFNADFAVKGFFSISGYLVYKSYLNSSNLTNFFEKRIRRIYPAYVFTILFCLLIGLFCSELSSKNFITESQTLRYLLSNLFFLNFLQPSLPGLFQGNLMNAVNGSLWTIKVELMLYLTIPLLAIILKKYQPLVSYLAILLAAGIWVLYFSKFSHWTLAAEMARQFPGQIAYFSFGCLLAARSNLTKWLPFLSIIGILLLFDFPMPYLMRLFIEPVGYGALTLYLCFISPSALNIGKIGDLSYGVYLFHFPIVQLLIHLQVYAMQPALGVLLSLIATLFMSFVSWKLVESRCLKRNSHYLRKYSS
jgi:peptidoglycan/LPS O-acetylase OafA/YrhL